MGNTIAHVEHIAEDWGEPVHTIDGILGEPSLDETNQIRLQLQAPNQDRRAWLKDRVQEISKELGDLSSRIGSKYRRQPAPPVVHVERPRNLTTNAGPNGGRHFVGIIALLIVNEPLNRSRRVNQNLNRGDARHAQRRHSLGELGLECLPQADSERAFGLDQRGEVAAKMESDADDWTG